MRIRPIHSLLLAALVYWTTGAALYLHERIEHAEPDGDETSALVSNTAASQTPTDNHPKHHHDHDDCPTCQLLAHMQADPVAPPPVVLTHAPCFFATAARPVRVVTTDVLVFAPIRGPPAELPISV